MWCSLFIRSLNLPAGNYIQGTVYLGFILFLQFPNLPLGVCLRGGFRLFIRLRTYFQRNKSGMQSVSKVSDPSCRELHPGDCLLGVHSFFTVSKPSSRGLSVGVKTVYKVKNLLPEE